ncbi:MAG: glycosyltransferase [Phycisphaeraceae bacterium]|nr:glycosyltransferase [Phycisphaeraceae bacterium]
MPDHAAHNTAPIDTSPPTAAGATSDRSRPPIATIVISTRNRRDELARTLESCCAQTGGAEGWVEVLVVDDASTDGTREMIAQRFPSVRVIHKTVRPGYIVSRNLGAREARGPIIFSIDDDAVYTSDDTVLRTLGAFDDPRVGAVAMPHIHVTDGPAEYDRAPDDGRMYVAAAYTGTAHALRRDVFLALGGYQEALEHQAEESEFCMRLWNAGYIVRIGVTPPIHHFPSAVRNYPRQLFLGARNAVLTSWFNVPTLYLPGRLLANFAGGCINALRKRHPDSFLSGVIAGLCSIPRLRSLRRPVGARPYRLFRRLLANTCRPIEEVLPLLPPRAPIAAEAQGAGA